MSRMTCLALLVLPGLCLAVPPRPLDLIPTDSTIALTVRDLAELTKKSDKLLGKDWGIKPSALFPMLYQSLGLDDKVIAQDRPVAIVCGSPELIGEPKLDLESHENKRIVAVLPIKDLDALAAAYKLKKADLKENTHLTLPANPGGGGYFSGHGFLRDDYLFLGSAGKSVGNIAKARMLRGELPEARQKTLDVADVLLYFGPSLIELARKHADPNWAPHKATPEETAAHKQVTRALLETNNVLAAFRLDDGLGTDLTVRFDKGGKESAAVLKALGGKGKECDLSGLPGGNVVAAFAAVGMKSENALLARVLATDFVLGLGRGIDFVSAADLPLYAGVFTEVYKRVDIGRFALYSPTDFRKHGKLAAVVIADVEDPKKFLTELAQLARFGDASKLDLKAEDDKADVEQLIKQLGDDDYQTRETATTKLALVGEPALPLLQKAEASDDPEVARRAKDLRERIEDAAALRKKEAKAGELQKKFRPSFALAPAAEERAGLKVDVVKVKLDAEDSPYAGVLKDLFGPGWDTIRLAWHGKKVVALIGSDLSLYDEALANVKGDKPGLEKAASLTAFRKQANPGRRAELHVAVGVAQALLTPPDRLPRDFKPTGALTSAALRTSADQLGLDVWVPAESIKDVGWWFR